MGIQQGRKVKATLTVNLRQSPGFEGKTADDIVRQVQAGEILSVIGGPEQRDGLTWWMVGGWIAESSPTQVRLLDPYVDKGGYDIDLIAAQYKLPVNVARAFLKVESGGQGFGPDGRLLIRFETHVFRRNLGNDSLFAIRFRIGSPSWLDHYLDGEPFHGIQEREYAAFEAAREMNDDAAFLSISMGLPQIMGFNHRQIGYDSPQAMFVAFRQGEDVQVRGFFEFLELSGVAAKLRVGDYRGAVELYNGPGQVDHYVRLIEQNL